MNGEVTLTKIKSFHIDTSASKLPYKPSHEVPTILSPQIESTGEILTYNFHSSGCNFFIGGNYLWKTSFAHSPPSMPNQ